MKNKKVEFWCSGPVPKGPELEKWRDAQGRALMVLNELSFPICMGQLENANALVRELSNQLTRMQNAVFFNRIKRRHK